MVQSVSMLINTRILAEVVATAKAACDGKADLLAAINRAVVELNRSAYWRYSEGVLVLRSTTSGTDYRIDDMHECKATKHNPKKVCKHKAARRLMLRYVQALNLDEAEGKGRGSHPCFGWSANGTYTAQGWKVNPEE